MKFAGWIIGPLAVFWVCVVSVWMYVPMIQEFDSWFFTIFAGLGIVALGVLIVVFSVYLFEQMFGVEEDNDG